MSENPINNAKIIYLNDVGGIKEKERQAIEQLVLIGITVETEDINWHSSEKFVSLLDKLITLAKDELKNHQYKYVLIVGAGAGGSMAVNIMARMHEKRLYAITLCSRLIDVNLPSWDRRSLERVAYIGKPNECKLYYDSVLYSTITSIQKLSKTDKLRIITAHQKADPSIPRQTMKIEGVKVNKIPGLGHGQGIASGVHSLPELINLLLPI